MITITLCILVLVASWVFSLPFEWAVTLTVFASLALLGKLLQYATEIAES